jgi:hypothetical protein
MSVECFAASSAQSLAKALIPRWGTVLVNLLMTGNDPSSVMIGSAV